MYECRGCGHRRAAPWTKSCRNCWGLYDHRKVHVDEGGERAAPQDGEIISFADAVVGAEDVPRIKTGVGGFDRVLSGGLAAGDVVLFSGDPGTGKTSLVIQALRGVVKHSKVTVLYVTGEQSTNKIGLTARRFGGRWPAKMLLVKEKDIDVILDHIDEHQPKVVVIDSIQTVDVDEDVRSGSAQALKIATEVFADYCHENKIALILICHKTKDGEMAGPKVVEHFADAAIMFEGNKKDPLRKLSCPSKNRSGETPTRAWFLMTAEGLVDAPDQDEEAEPSSTPPREAKRSTPWAPPSRELSAVDATALELDCAEPEYRGQGGRACTASDGTREAGLHTSRVRTARDGVRAAPKMSPKKIIPKRTKPSKTVVST